MGTGSFAYQWASERERESETGRQGDRESSSINNGVAEVAFAMFVAKKLFCSVKIKVQQQQQRQQQEQKERQKQQEEQQQQ